MAKLRIGVLGPSEIAFRKFLPALKKSINFEYVGVAIANSKERNLEADDDTLYMVLSQSREKALNFQKFFNGIVFDSYEEIITADNIDAIYIPLPPGLHYYWAKKALDNGKHILVEKPFTTSLENTEKLLKLAEQKQLAVHENYAFCYHEQLNKVNKLIFEGEIGELRQIRTAFGFPYRGAADFRYHKSMGGGALLDCGGYPIKLSTYFLGNTAQVMTANLASAREHDVDIFGSATIQNNEGVTAQISFGMDNFYKCEVEIWGSKGYIFAPRIFTAPANEKVTLVLNNGEEKKIEIQENDQFLESLHHFYYRILNSSMRLKGYEEIKLQSSLVKDILDKSFGKSKF
jgi:dTDP-3,4-didehydro-2,6-dideoxy-alpha-D-glucose 3-reductase